MDIPETIYPDPHLGHTLTDNNIDGLNLDAKVDNDKDGIPQIVVPQAEIPNLSGTEYGVINDRCNIASSLDRSSTDLFGGIPVVIIMGDFYQFPPVKGQALWKLGCHVTSYTLL